MDHPIEPERAKEPTKKPPLPPKPKLLSSLAITSRSSSTNRSNTEDDFQWKPRPPLMHTNSMPVRPPPLLPTQRSISLYSSQIQTLPKSTTAIENNELDNPLKEGQLSDIVTDSNILPMKVAFCDSIYGLCESFTFASNELFDVHFLKESMFANVRTNMGEEVKIPLQAPFQYTLDYPPNSICDMEYKVPQLMKLTYLPTIAIVKDESNGHLKLRSNKSSEFVNDEVLIFKSKMKSSTIECFSLSFKETKTIHKSSDLTLMINPSKTAFKFIELAFFDLPVQVKIHVDSKLQSQLKSTSTIVSLTKEKSLITSFSDAEVHDDEYALYEIFINVPIDFQQVDMSSSADKQKLIKKSETIFEKFSPLNVTKVITDVNDNYLQKQLFDTLTDPGLGDEQWKTVTELIKPKTFDQSSAHMKTEQDLMPSPHNHVLPNDNADPIPIEPIYTSLPISLLKNMPNPAPLSPHLSSTLASMSVPGLVMDSTNHSATFRKPASFQTGPLGDMYIECKEAVVSNNNKYEGMTQHEGKELKMKIEDLSCDQVLILLDKLGLSKYKNLFIEEKISGGILQELDEEMLEQDLGITSRLHRLKLKRVIEGKEPLDSFFE